MRTGLLCFLVPFFFLAACATPNQGPPPAQTSLPDARDLAEHPLDVLSLPQP
jgi:hypothetical protein